MQSDESAVVDILTAYSATLREGDIEAWSALWDTEGIEMAPNTSALIGRPAIHQNAIKTYRDCTVRVSIDNKETQVAGDWAFARGFYTATKTPKGGGDARIVDGKYLRIFRRQTEGEWKLYVDCTNSNVTSR